jgi:hypothetical protein
LESYQTPPVQQTIPTKLYTDPFADRIMPEMDPPAYSGNPGVWANQIVGFDPLSGPIAQPPVMQATKPIQDRLITVDGVTYNVTPEQMAQMSPEDQARIAEENQRIRAFYNNVTPPVPGSMPYDIQGYPTTYPTYNDQVAETIYGPEDPAIYSPDEGQLNLDNIDPTAPTDQYIGPIVPGQEDPRAPYNGGNQFATGGGGGQNIVPAGYYGGGGGGYYGGGGGGGGEGGGGGNTPPPNSGLDWFNYYGLNPPYQTVVPLPQLTDIAPVSEGVGSLLPNIVVVDPFAALR